MKHLRNYINQSPSYVSTTLVISEVLTIISVIGLVTIFMMKQSVEITVFKVILCGILTYCGYYFINLWCLAQKNEQDLFRLTLISFDESIVSVFTFKFMAKVGFHNPIALTILGLIAIGLIAYPLCKLINQKILGKNQ